MKCQIKSQNNKKVTTSTNVVVTPPCKPIQHSMTQQMQDSMLEHMMIQSQLNQHSQFQPIEVPLSANMIGISHYQLNQHSQDQAMQDYLSVNNSQYQFFQHSHAQQMQDFRLPNMMFQNQANQHFRTQQVQDLLSANISRYQYFNAQQRQCSLSTDAISMPQDQHFETAMEEDYSDPWKFINFDNIENYVNYFEKV